MNASPLFACFRKGLLLFPLVASCGVAAEDLLAVEKAAGEWVRTRAETVRLETEWAGERGLLASTVMGLQERAGQLEDKRDQLRAKTATERAELAALTEKNREAAATIAAMEERLRALGAGLLELRPLLPPRLSAALEFSLRSLESAELSAGERMQLVMTVLNRCGQFNSSITCGEEVLVMAGEPAKSMEVIYWGLSHGYALDRAGKKAWLGSPGAKQWEWEPRPEAAEAVARLIAIYYDRADPELVAVPVRLAAQNR